MSETYDALVRRRAATPFRDAVDPVVRAHAPHRWSLDPDERVAATRILYSTRWPAVPPVPEDEDAGGITPVWRAHWLRHVDAEFEAVAVHCPSARMRALLAEAVAAWRRAAGRVDVTPAGVAALDPFDAGPVLTDAEMAYGAVRETLFSALTGWDQADY